MAVLPTGFSLGGHSVQVVGPGGQVLPPGTYQLEVTGPSHYGMSGRQGGGRGRGGMQGGGRGAGSRTMGPAGEAHPGMQQHQQQQDAQRDSSNGQPQPQHMRHQQQQGNSQGHGQGQALLPPPPQHKQQQVMQPQFQQQQQQRVGGMGNIQHASGHGQQGQQQMQQSHPQARGPQLVTLSANGTMQGAGQLQQQAGATQLLAPPGTQYIIQQPAAQVRLGHVSGIWCMAYDRIWCMGCGRAAAHTDADRALSPSY